MYSMTGETRYINPVLHTRHTAKDRIMVGRYFVVTPPARLVIQPRLTQPGEACNSSFEGQLKPIPIDPLRKSWRLIGI